MSPSPAAAAARFHVGVDGGGSGTRARLQNAASMTLGHGQAGPSGLSQGVAQAWRHVQQAIAAAFRDAQLPLAAPSEIALGLGLAGAGVVAQREAFLAADPGFAACVLVNDGTTQLLGAFAGAPGIVVAAGTGSVATALYADGSLRQVGGWGFPVGDQGSGAWLGLCALQHAQAALDGRAAAGALAQAVYAQCGADAPALLAWCAASTAAAALAPAYAALAPAVFAAAGQGDAVAQALLQAGADELMRLVDALQPLTMLTTTMHAPASTSTSVLVPVPVPVPAPVPVPVPVPAPAPAPAPNPTPLPLPLPLPVVVRGSVGERLAPLWPAALRERCVAPAGDSADGALRLLRQAMAAVA
jgi:glucosamine kinase